MPQFLRVRVEAVDAAGVICEFPSGELCVFPYTAAERAKNNFNVEPGDEVVLTLTRSVEIINEILKDTAHKIEDVKKTNYNQTNSQA